MWVVLFLLLLNSLALQDTFLEERDSTCSIPAVEEGNVANLTCHFPSDISDSQHGLRVLFYSDSNPNNSITVVYSALTNGKLEFFTHPDFSFDEIGSDHVNILKLKASKAYVGKYVCHSDPSFRVKSCIFTLKVPNKSGTSSHAASISTITTQMFNGLQMPCEIPSVPLGHPTNLTCHFNKNILELKKKIVVLHYCQKNENAETIMFTTVFDGKMEFYTHPDYVLHNTRKIQVMIPRVTQKHVGRYVCLTLQSDYYEECNFTLKDTFLEVRDSTCSIPAVEEGNVANLTCHFPSDISDSQHGLNVLFYSDSNPNNSITVVYSALTNVKLEFFTHPDFSFDEIVSDHVNILIFKASKSNVGKYVCHSDPSFRVKSCIFTLKEQGSTNVLSFVMGTVTAVTTIAVIISIIAAIRQIWIKKNLTERR